jgi:hypothetical protein
MRKMMNPTEITAVIQREIAACNQALLKEATLLATCSTDLPQGEAARLEYIVRIAGAYDSTLYAMFNRVSSLKGKIKARQEDLKMMERIQTQNIQLPAKGDFWVMTEHKRRYKHTAKPVIYEVTREVEAKIGKNEYSTSYGTMIELSPSGQLNTGRDWTFSLSGWLQRMTDGGIKPVQYLFKDEYTPEDLNRIVPLIPFVLATAQTQEEKRKLICQQNLRKLVKRARIEAGVS